MRRSVASSSPHWRESSIAGKLAFLGSPAAYDDHPDRVERIETHFSWVFLTGTRAYKLKKPVAVDGTDLSLLDLRLRNAEAEIRLNRRLARDVYLGIVPLTYRRGRGLGLGKEGQTVDWLVEMVRLPSESMLDRRIISGNLQHCDVRALGDRLAGFFANARRVSLPPRAYIGRFLAECRLASAAFVACGSRRQVDDVDRLVRRARAFVMRRRNLLLARRSRLIEGHGDLRPEHISIGSGIRIIDCLEFRPDLRLLDPVDELAFLAMECDRLGARGIEAILFRRYRRRTGDFPSAILVRFYKLIGALVRARVAILHLQERRVRDPAKWLRRAAEYLAIAGREARHLDRENHRAAGRTSD